MKKVLIIEDEKSLSKSLRLKLESFQGANGKGIIVQEAGGVEEGMTKVKTDKPDVILLDIMLPGGLNGFDFLEQLKKDKDLKEIPVIVLTNLDSEAGTAMEIGASEYFVKVNTPLSKIESVVKKYL